MEVIKAQMFWDSVMENIQKLKIHDEMGTFLFDTAYPLISTSSDPFQMLLLVYENAPVLQSTLNDVVINNILMNVSMFAIDTEILVTDEQFKKLDMAEHLYRIGKPK